MDWVILLAQFLTVYMKLMLTKLKNNNYVELCALLDTPTLNLNNEMDSI
jgi:hypothetical protein